MARIPVEPVRTLLVMEQTPRNRSLVEAVDALPGLTVVGSAWGAERLQALLYSAGVELALIDLGLSGMLPGDACRAIKGRLLASPVILIADDTSVRQRELMRAWHADAVVVRPNLQDALLPAIVALFPTRVPNVATAPRTAPCEEPVSHALA
jgi:DNA-binding response OmpR family regulator